MGRWAQARKRGGAGPPAFPLAPPLAPILDSPSGEIEWSWTNSSPYPDDAVNVQGSYSINGAAFVTVPGDFKGEDIHEEGATTGTHYVVRIRWTDGSDTPLSGWSPTSGPITIT